VYGHEEPTRIKPDELELLLACRASAGPRSKLPPWNLDRWVTVKDAIDEWYSTKNPDEIAIPDIEERMMSWLDPVQRQIASELFKTYRDLMPKRVGETVDLEPPNSEVFDDTGAYRMSAAVQYTLTLDEATEHVKLKSGRSRVSDDDKAILLEGSEDGEVDLIEVRLGDGVVDQIEMPALERRQRIQHLFEIPKKAAVGSRGTRPGLHCFNCGRPARCGQYPAVSKTVGSRDRAVVVSKTWLSRLHLCQRQVAWSRLHSIPKELEDPDIDTTARAAGSAFHEAAAIALNAPNPEAAVAEYCNSLDDRAKEDLLWLWEQHVDLTAHEPHPVQFRDTEYAVGATFTSHGPDSDSWGRQIQDATIGVVLLGLADGVGREADGTPAVVEHRTGTTGSYPLEPELYALGTHLLTGKTPVAVHIHRLRNSGGPQCDRTLFTETDLAAATDSLQNAANTIAAWNPNDALSPPYTVGDWCNRCPFNSRCGQYRS
jgi:hypothetical protein